MHPVAAADCAGTARDLAFAHFFVSAPSGIAVIHAPVTLVDETQLHFHVSRRNRALPLLAGARAIGSLAGAHGHVSPDWYAGR